MSFARSIYPFQSRLGGIYISASSNFPSLCVKRYLNSAIEFLQSQTQLDSDPWLAISAHRPPAITAIRECARAALACMTHVLAHDNCTIQLACWNVVHFQYSIARSCDSPTEGTRIRPRMALAPRGEANAGRVRVDMTTGKDSSFICMERRYTVRSTILNLCFIRGSPHQPRLISKAAINHYVVFAYWEYVYQRSTSQKS